MLRHPPGVRRTCTLFPDTTGFRVSAGTASGPGGAAPAVAAEETAPESVAAEGDIIVTAQRRAESMNDIGMAIQAVDAETLEQLRVTDMRDLTAVAPSLDRKSTRLNSSH